MNVNVAREGEGKGKNENKWILPLLMILKLEKAFEFQQN